MSEDQLPKTGFFATTLFDRFLIVCSLVGLVASMFLLFFYRPDVGSNNPIIGEIWPEGTLRRRHAHTLAWSDIEDPQPIYLRDIIFTPKNAKGRAKLQDGRTIDLAPDSLVQFDDINLDGIQITLLNFDLFRLVPLKQKQLAFLPDPRPLELLHAEATQRLREHLAKPLGLKPVAKIPPFQFAFRLSDFKIVLIIPGKETFNFSKNRWLEMVWTPIPMDDVTFQLDIVYRERPDLPMSFRPPKNTTVVQYDIIGDYTWQVSASRGSERIKSKESSFAMKNGTGKISTAVVRKLMNESRKPKK